MYQLTKEQLKALGMDTYSNEQVEQTAHEIGKGIFSRALTHFLEELSDAELAAVNGFVDHANSLEDVLYFLKTRYPEFGPVLESYEEAFVTDYLKAFSK